MLRLTPGLLANLPMPVVPMNTSASTPPENSNQLKMPVLSQEAFEQASALNLCPHWQRLNHKGLCVDRWWVGPPMSWVSAAVVTTVGMGLLGWILVAAGKIKTLQPAVRKVRKVVRVPRWEEL